MKLATINNGTRDGALHVVTQDLSRSVSAHEIAGTLQHALDEWATTAPQLVALATRLEADASMGASFDQDACTSPLPRAGQWADGSAYVNHVELVRKARGAQMPESFWTDPLMYQGGSDTFLGPREDIVMPQDETFGIDMEGEVAIITTDVPMGVSPDRALDYIALIMIVNDVSLRGLIPGELAKGFGFFQSKPSSAFSPCAVTLDELGEHWREGKVHLPLLVHYNGESFGKANAGVDMTFHFGQLIAHAARTRRLGAGTIIGSGTVSNKMADGTPGKPIAEGGLGYSCIAELRMIETIENGVPTTPFMRFGDRVEIDMQDHEGRSVFGAIRQKVAKLPD